MQPVFSPAAAPAVIAAELRQEALRLGFSRVGITGVIDAPHHDAFRGWLARGPPPHSVGSQPDGGLARAA